MNTKHNKALLLTALSICMRVLDDFNSGVSFTSENAIQLIELYSGGNQKLAAAAMFVMAEII